VQLVDLGGRLQADVGATDGTAIERDHHHVATPAAQGGDQITGGFHRSAGTHHHSTDVAGKVTMFLGIDDVGGDATTLKQ
jgi:hypothetical protein